MSKLIERVTIKNFKCHDFLDLRLPDGITSVVAANGKGKSSLVQAIVWCLFGPIYVPSSQSELVREGEDLMEVSVSMVFDGASYTFYRSFSEKGGTDASVYEGGEQIATKSSGVAEFLHEKGIDYEGFQMIYAAQGDLAFFVHATPAERKGIMASLFHTDRLDDTIATTRSDYKEYKALVEGLPEEDELYNVKSCIEDAHNRKEEAIKEKIEWENELEEVKGKLKEASDAARYVPRIMELNSSISSLVSAIEALEAEKEGLESIRPEYDMSLEELEEKRDKLKSEVDEALENHTSKREYMVSLETKMEALRNQHESLSDGTCPVCGSSGEDILSLVQACEAEIDDVNSILDELEKERDEIQDYAKGVYSKISAIDKRIKVSEKWEKGGGEARIQVIDSKIEEYQEKLQDLAEDLDELPEVDPDRIDRLQLKTESLKDVISGVDRRVLLAERDINRYEDKARDLLDRLEGSELLKRKVEGLDKLSKTLPKFRDTVMAQSLEWVASRSSDLLTAAWGSPNKIEVDTNIGFWVNGRKLESYSSGQVDLICVCIRIAISEYLSKRVGFRGLMILDGVFDRIDVDNRDSIGRILSEINVDQVIILSHFEVPVIGGRELKFR